MGLFNAFIAAAAIATGWGLVGAGADAATAVAVDSAAAGTSFVAADTAIAAPAVASSFSAPAIYGGTALVDSSWALAAPDLVPGVAAFDVPAVGIGSALATDAVAAGATSFSAPPIAGGTALVDSSWALPAPELVPGVAAFDVPAVGVDAAATGAAADLASAAAPAASLSPSTLLGLGKALIGGLTGTSSASQKPPAGATMAPAFLPARPAVSNVGAGNPLADLMHSFFGNPATASNPLASASPSGLDGILLALLGLGGFLMVSK